MTLLTRLTVLAALAGAIASAQPLPKAETILDRYIQATGGKAAYQKHTHETLTGTITFPEQGLNGRLTRYAMAPDKEYSVVELGPMAKSSRASPMESPGRRARSLGRALKPATKRTRLLAKRSSTAQRSGAPFSPRRKRLARNP